ncbi:MAG: RNA methyltransferase [Ignavibacteriae bacterium]|nr:RNA methyltransferase [Ignavibacteriota bacterium]
MSWSKIFVGDVHGKSLKNENGSETSLVLIGAEGGFSPKELTFLENDPRTTLISLGNRRLRAETAAIVALSLLTKVN